MMLICIQNQEPLPQTGSDFYILKFAPPLPRRKQGLTSSDVLVTGAIQHLMGLGRPEGQVLPHTSMGARDRRLLEPNRGMDSSTLLGAGPHSMSIHILSTQWMLARLKSGKNQEGFRR